MKRDTFMTGRRARALLSPDREAAKFLAEQARRYVKGAANVGDIEIAITEFRVAIANKKAGE